MKSGTFGASLAFAVLFAAAPFACAQYPSRTIRIIVPFAPGSANDVVARFIGPPLAEALGRQVVIDNRPGAGGNIGAELTANSPPDGYTMMIGNIAHAIAMTLHSKPGYDLARDFAPVSWLASGSFMLVVHPSVPGKSLKELIALAKARPGQLNVATSGAGIYLASELFQRMAGVKMTNVSYRSTPYALTALVSGEVSVGFSSTSAATLHVRSARLRGLAVTSARRSPMAPDIATIAEAGVPGFDVSGWYGLLVPTGTPAAIVSRLHAESVKVLNRPDVKERFAATDLEPVGSAPEKFGSHIRSEIERWGKLVKATGLRPE